MSAKWVQNDHKLLFKAFFTQNKCPAYNLHKSGQHLVFNDFFMFYTVQPTCLSTTFVDNVFKNHKKNSKWAQSEYKMIINRCLKHFSPKTNALLIIYTNQVNTLFLMVFSLFIQRNPHAYPQFLWTKHPKSMKNTGNDHKVTINHCFKGFSHQINALLIIYTKQTNILFLIIF